MLRVAVTFTAEEIFPRDKLDVAGARALLSSLDLHEVLEFCALLNAVNQISVYEVGGWKSPGGRQLLERVLSDLLEAVYHERARAIYETSPRFSPLAGAAINGVIGLACRWCPEQGGKPLNNIRYRRNVARVLFALQGMLVDKQKLTHIGDEAGLRAAFPYVARSVLASKQLNMHHDMGRLHALVSQSDIGKILQGKDRCSVSDWFKDKIGLPVSQYQCVMTALGGFAGQFKASAPRPEHLWLPTDAFIHAMADLSREVAALLQTAETTPQMIVADSTEPNDLADAIYGLDHLLVRPLLRVGNRHLVTSFEAVFANFMRGLTYLSSRVAEQRVGASDLKLSKGARGGFGPIFEGYICWLAHQWFDRTEVTVIENYRVELPNQKKGETPPQGDLLLVRDGIGYAIEVKAIVPSRQMRKGGELTSVVHKLVPQRDGKPDPSGLILQTRRLAQGLAEGAGVQSDGTAIPPLKGVFPIGIVFELRVPYPFTIPLEADIELACGEKVFEESMGIAPFQFFEIESFEQLDEVFNLPSDVSAVLSTLQKRAKTKELRYDSLEALCGGCRNNAVEKPGLLSRLCDESEGFVKANCKFQTPSAAPTGLG